MRPASPTDTSESTLTGRVEESLTSVLDPCSVFNGTRRNFVELGMVQRIEQRGERHVAVTLLLDDPVCLYVAQIHDQIRDAALRVDGVDEVTIDFATDEIWTEDRASDEVRAENQQRRQHLQERIRMNRQSVTERTNQA